MTFSFCWTELFAQNLESYIVLNAQVCKEPIPIMISKKKATYFLQLGQEKKTKVSSETSRDSVILHFRAMIETGLAKHCKNTTYDESEFAATVDLAINLIGTKFFPPKTRLFPTTIDSVSIDSKHYFAMVMNTSNGFILTAVIENADNVIETHDIAKWDSTGKFLHTLVSQPLQNAPFLQHLNAFVKIQKDNPKIKLPNYYLLYNSSPTPPTYELLYSEIPGIGIKTGVKVPGDEAINLVTSSITKLKIDSQNFIVLPFKTAEDEQSANPRIKKGAVIWHQQIPYSKGNSFNLSTAIYPLSPGDSTIVILKYLGQSEIDTLMPIDLSIDELDNLISFTAKASGSWDSKTADALSKFLLAHSIKYPLMVASLNPSNTTKAVVTKLDSNNALKSGSIQQPSGKDTAAKSGNHPDSLAKYDMLNNITLLNAFNFDFTGPLTTSYLGLFNIFAPDFGYIKKKKRWQQSWGGFAGIEKINYGNANINGGDSTQIEYLYQYVLKNPISYNAYNQTIDSGATYYYQYNKYNLSTKNTSWSFYFDPTYRIPIIKLQEKDPKVGFYAHLHLELLVNKFSGNISMQTISQDSGQYKSPASPTPMNHYLPNQYTNNSTIITGNFGAGIMLYLAPFRDTLSYFYFQATGGLSVNAPNLSAITTLSSKTDSTGRTTISLPSINSAQVNPTIIYPHNRFFYMFRTIFLQALSNKTQLIIGMSVRGILPAKTPQYAAYLGLNLDLSILSTLFGSK